MTVITMTPSSPHQLRDEFGRSWHYVNAYFEPRVPCSSCGGVDFAGWQCRETGEVRCNDCVLVQAGHTAST